MDHDVTVAVFARAPVLGEVKTRLARDVGEEEALKAHCEMLERTLEAVEIGPWSTELWLAGDAAAFPISRAGVEVRLQAEGDLGERMLAAVASIIGRGAWAVIIGCDCPVMSAAYIDAAIDALRRDHDVVFGPAEDGGYVLVGMRSVHRRLFEGVSWSTSEVLAQSLAQASKHDLRVALLETLWDVDTVADWRRWCRLGSAG
jgi:rSAM/selenodomain-associated transferase 1